MKKNLTVLLAALLIGGTAFGQAVSDRNIIPVAVNLNQVLRMTITNGGNIEFVFNTIDQYKDGITGAAGTSADMYQTDFTVSSSTRWLLSYGSESATFLGVDNPANTLPLNNVGFTITSNAALTGHSFESTGPGIGVTDAEELWDAQQNAVGGLGGEPAALVVYPANLIEDNESPTQANAGDASDNDFTLTWRCGTGENLNSIAPMSEFSLIDQDPSPNPDRYVANVLFELIAL